MASSNTTVTSGVSATTPESTVCASTVNAFILPAAFPGVDINRQHIANFVQTSTVSVQQQQSQMHLVSSVANTTANTMTGGRQKQGRQNNIQHQQLLQNSAPILATIAFPGNPIQTHVQQHASIQIPQHQAQPITVVANNSASNIRGAQWPCPACKIGFKSATELQTHLTAHTKIEKSVPCTTCGKLFASQERVRIHIRVAHGEKSCACEICGSGFSYRCKLLDHMRTHTGDKPFRCDVCNRSFSQKNHLRRHNMIHTGERPYPCEVCGRGFYRKDKLNRHRKIHMSNQEKSAKTEVSLAKFHARQNNSNVNVQTINSPQQTITNVVPQPILIPLQLGPKFTNSQQWMGQPFVTTSASSNMSQQASSNLTSNNDRQDNHTSPSDTITGEV